MTGLPFQKIAAAVATAAVLAPAAMAEVAPRDVQQVVCTTTPVAPVEAEAVVLSRNGRRLVLHTDFDPVGENDDRSEELFLWDDAAGLRQLTDLPRGLEMAARPSISAAGDRVAFAAGIDPLGTNPDGSAELFLWDEEDGLRQVTDVPEGFVDRVEVSADGRRIAFTGDVDPLGSNLDRGPELFVWGEDLGIVQVTEGSDFRSQVFEFAPSADGRRVAFSHAMGGPVRRISLWDETAGSIAIAHPDSGSSFSPVISADGRRIAFSSMADLVGENPDGNPEVFLWDETAGLVQITDSAGTFVSASSPSMSAAGDRLAFSSNADLVGENRDGGFEIFLWREDGGLVQITSWRGDALGSLGPHLSADGLWIAFQSRADLVGLNPVHLSKVFLWGEGFGTTQVTRDTLGTSFVAGISAHGERVAVVSRPFPQPSDPEEGFEVAVADCGEPPPPPGPWLESAAVPGFRFKVRILDGDGFSIDGALEPDCIPEALCVSGALPGRTEAFLRVVGPRPNQRLWTVLAKFSTSTLHVWVEQEATGLLQFYVLPGAQPRTDVLPGLVDRDAFTPVPMAESSSAAAGLRALPSLLGDLAVAVVASAADAPAPPPGPYLVTPELPGFRVKVRITPRGGEPQPVRREADCIPETLCVSGALPGRSELFVRIVGPKPNGRLWPTLVRLTPSEIEVWIEQVSTGELRYYRLRPLPPAGEQIPGLFDRLGFLP